MLYKDDDDLTYDLKRHQYVISEKAITDFTGINLQSIPFIKNDINPDNAIKRFCRYCSRAVYQYIYVQSGNPAKVMNYLLARGYLTNRTSKEDIRQPLIDAICNYAYSLLLSGNDFTQFTGLQLDGVKIDKNTLSAQSIPLSVENCLKPTNILSRVRRIIFDDLDILMEEGEY